jgi:hypothetical protein
MRDMFAKGRRVHARGEQLSRLAEADAVAILAALASGVSQSELSRRYAVSQPTIGAIASRRTWKHLSQELIPSQVRDTHRLSKKLRAGDVETMTRIVSTIKACAGRFVATATTLRISGSTLWQWQRRYPEIQQTFLAFGSLDRTGRRRTR